MKKSLIMLAGVFVLAGCTNKPKEQSKEEQLLQIKINVVDYCGEQIKKNDLPVTNYLLAFKRERDGVKAKGSPYENLRFIPGKADSVEVTLMLPNSSGHYTKNAQGNPVFETGLHFGIDKNGKVTGHMGYLLYYGKKDVFVTLTGDNANLLYNSFKP